MFALSAKATIRAAISAFFCFLLVACGGGSSDFDSDVTSGGADGAPTVTSVEVATTASSDLLMMGDVVTVNITASENILAPTVIIAGDAVDSVTGSGTDWVAEREMIPGDPNGLITISVSITDVSGVVGETVSTDAIGSAISFQNPEPLQINESLSDEFSGTSLSSTGWTFENGDGTEFGIPGWGNNELQIYTEDQVTVADGNLLITAIEAGAPTGTSGKSSAVISQATSGDFRSGRIRSNTVVDMSQPAGRVEVRAKMPFGQGIWPAIWMLPTQDVVDEFGIWPLTGEIDIVEAINLGVDGKQTIQSTIHYGFPFPDNSFDYVLYEPGLNPQDNFHIYAMEWETDSENNRGEIRFYFNDVHYATHTSDRWFAVQDNSDGTFTELDDPAPFDRTFNVLINLAVGGNLPGNPDATTVFPRVLEVDYVRVFECEFPEAGECTTGIDESIQPVGSGVIEAEKLVVFDDAINSEAWPDGVFAFDQALGFADCAGTDLQDCVSMSWEVVTSDDPTRGQVYQVNYAPDAQFAGIILGSNRSGADLSNFASGEVVFDLNVTSNPEDANFIMKVDCVGCPVDAGQREQNLGTPGAGWNEIRIPVADLINANGGPGNGGLVIGDVTTGLVLFPAFGSTAGVSYQIDNIRWISGEDSGSGSTTGTGAVYSDALDGQWVDGISAFDQAIGFSSCSNDGGAECPSVNWEEVAVDDTARGTVLGVTYASDAQFAGMIVGLNNAGLDMSEFATGNVIFDVNVTSNPSSAPFIMKIDCVGCPVDAGQREQNLGTPNAGWQTFTVPVADLINANGGPSKGGLVIESVTTGLVLFPAFGSTAGVEYQLDNVRWEAGAGGGDSGGDSGGDDSGSGGMASTGTIPGHVLYATSATVDTPFPDGGITDFGSGAIFDANYAGDSSFIPVFSVTSGEGYGAGVHVAFLAVQGYAAGFADGYDTFNAKVKGSPDNRIEIKLIGNGEDSVALVDVTTYAGSTSLGDGWYELVVPFSEFSNSGNISGHSGWLLGPPGDQADETFIFLLTDVGFSSGS